MDESLPVLLTIEILDYEKKGSTVYYSIEIMANGTKKWTITRKFKDIEDMHKKLIKKLSNMPYLPAKSIFSLGEDDLDKRRDDLEKYLNVLASRKDTLSDPEIKSFLELESHIKTETLTVIKELYEIPNLPMSVRDFVYIPSKGVLFVLVAETRIVSKIGSFLSSISKSQEVSSVIAYKEESEGSFEFTKLWQYNLSSEGSMLTWDHGLTILAIGHVNGLIECIRVSTELEYSRYTSFCKVHCHTQTITGIILLPETGHLLSSSLDKYLVKTDIANNEAHLAEKEHPQALTTMILDKANGRFFVGDSVGTVFVYSTEGQMRNLATIAYHQENFIKTLFFDKQRSLLVAGSNQGNIVVYDIGKPGREKFSTYTTSFETVKQIRGLHFVGKNKELYVASATGTIAFMNSLTTIAFHMLDAHSGEISRMVYFENDKLMVTGSADRSIKFWRYPFDPNEKIQPKKVHAPKAAKYDYPELKSNNTNAQSDERYQSEEEEEEEEERDSREALTLFQYRPAKEPVFESSEDSEDENFKESVAKANQKPVQQVKEEEPESDEELPKEEKKKAPKIRKRPEHPLALAEPDEEDSDEEVPQKAAEASPKSFLFKNSVIEVVSKRDIKDLEKKAKVGGKPKEGKEKEPEVKAGKAETDDPLSRSLKPPVVKKQTKEETVVKTTSDKETKPAKADKEEKKVEAKDASLPEKKKEDVPTEDSKEKKPAEVEVEAEAREKGERESDSTKKKEEKESAAAPKKKEEKEPAAAAPKKKEEEKKTADKKPPAAQAKVIADDPLSFPGPIVKKKTPSAKPKPQQKVIINESDSNVLHIPTQPAKKKVIRKSLMDSDSDDDNLLDFQGLKSGAQSKGSKTSSKKKQQDSDEDEGLAGWAS